MNNKNERQRLREKQGNRCYYCGEVLQDGGDNPATLDHVIPRSLVRSIKQYIPDNHVIACYNCNQKKADKVPAKWDKMKAGRRAGDWVLTDFGNWIYNPLNVLEEY